jgi:large subunit ribosomal protein L29
MRKEQLREMTKDELLQRKLEAEEELFNLRLQKASKELDNPLRVRVLRKELARINTILREDELKMSSRRCSENILGWWWQTILEPRKPCVSGSWGGPKGGMPEWGI